MANHTTETGERPIAKGKGEVIKEAQRIEESLLYSSRGHWVAASFWGNFHLWIGIPMVILSTIAGASVLAQFDTQHLIAGVLSTIVAALAAVITFLNPNEKESAHLKCGNSYDSLLSEVRIFRVIDCWKDDGEDVLGAKLRGFSERRTHLNQTSLQIPRWAYQRAKKGIEAGESDFKVDKG